MVSLFMDLKTETMKYNIEISKILDKHLPANGVGTERELLRMNIHRDMCDLINKLTIPVVMRSCFDAGVEYQRQFESKLSESYDKPNFDEWHQNNY